MRMIHYSISGLILGYVRGLVVSVDTSCSTKAGVFDAIDQAINMAKLSAQRLRSGSDTDFANVYQRIFSTDKSDTTSLAKVTTILDCISGITYMAESGKKRATDIRIYCDNDAVKTVDGKGRWQPRPNGLKGFVDNKNEIQTDDDGLLGCQQAKVLGATYGTPSNTASTQPPGRSTITICDLTFETKPSSFEDAAGKDFEKLTGGIQVLSSMLSHVFLHEFTHIPSCNRVDQPVTKGAKKLAYGWAKSIALTTQDSLLNADNYAFLGIFGLLAEEGYSLPRNVADDDTQQAAWGASCVAGTLQHIVDITKRSFNTAIKSTAKAKRAWFNSFATFGKRACGFRA